MNSSNAVILNGKSKIQEKKKKAKHDSTYMKFKPLKTKQCIRRTHTCGKTIEKKNKGGINIKFRMVFMTSEEGKKRWIGQGHKDSEGNGSVYFLKT